MCQRYFSLFNVSGINLVNWWPLFSSFVKVLGSEHHDVSKLRQSNMLTKLRDSTSEAGWRTLAASCEGGQAW